MSQVIHRLDLDNTFGVAFIGVVVAACLHGVSCVQAWYYFTHHQDGWGLRTLVALVMIFDTIHQALISHTIYTYLVTNYNNPIELGLTVWSMLVEVIFNGLTALLVQSFLAHRVWRLSNQNFWITGAVMILVLGEFGCVVAFTGLALVHVRTFTELADLKSLSIVVNALAAACDVLIASTLCWLLHTSRTGFQRSDTMINKLIIFAVNTGLLTSLCAVASLISIVTAPTTFLYITFFFCIGRLYSNSLLATLNARKMIRTAAEGVNSTSDGKLSFSLRELRDFSKGGGSERGRPTNISIKIDTTKEFSTDVDNHSQSIPEKDRRVTIHTPTPIVGRKRDSIRSSHTQVTAIISTRTEDILEPSLGNASDSSGCDAV